jgi:hypothetical protein
LTPADRENRLYIEAARLEVTMRAGIIALSLLLAGSAPGFAQGRSQPAPADGFSWRAAPPTLPKGAQMAVISGDPAKKGPFVVRLKLPANYAIPPHQHPTAEQVTVLYGAFNAGMGDKLDKRKGKPYARGESMTIPAKTNHYAWTSSETVLQVKGTGPFAMTYVDPADDPSKPPPAQTN